jgi:hypothetical protein
VSNRHEIFDCAEARTGELFQEYVKRAGGTMKLKPRSEKGLLTLKTFWSRDRTWAEC